MKVRLVAFDLDGTLLGKDLQISDRVRAAVARMQQAGIRGCVVTGRMYRSALPFARELHFDAPLVCYQGASVMDPIESRSLREVPLSAELVGEVIAKTRADGMYLQLYKNDRYYCETSNRFSNLYASVSSVEPIAVPSLSDEFAGEAATKAVVIADPGEAAQYARRLQATFAGRAYVTRSYAEFVEILDPAVDKGAAFAFVAHRLGVPMDETAAIGDAWNDAPLLRAAQMGFAMGSAPQELCDEADAVVGDVTQDGVAQAIEEYLLA